MIAGSASLLRVNIFSELRADILACRIPPNSAMREQELAKRFGVSKSPVREALHRLQQESLVLITPRQGYRVSPITIGDAKEMLQLRKILELAAVEVAAKVASDGQLAELDRFREVRGDYDTDDFISYNKDFHHAIALCSGNGRLASEVRKLEDQAERLVRVSVAVYKAKHIDGLVKEHEEIIDAIQGRQGRIASRLLRDHITRGEKRVIQQLTENAVLQ